MGKWFVHREFLLLLLVFAWMGQDLLRAGTQYQFEGKIEFLEGRRMRRVTAVVFLEGTNVSYFGKALAGPKGEFKFKNLDTGVYRLMIRVPRQGSMEQTVDIGPSFADRKGRVKATFDFFPERRMDSNRTIPLSQLSISKDARRDFKEAEERLSENDTEGAITYLRRALEKSPEFAAAWNHLGTIAYSSQELAEAEHCFRKALEHNPNSYQPTVNLGGVLLSSGKLDQALQVNKKAVEIRPDDALPYSRVGKTLFGLKRLEEAEYYLKWAKLLDPKHFSYPGLYLAEIYRIRKDSGSLVRELEEFLKAHPDVEFAFRLRKTLEHFRSENARCSAAANP